MHLSNLKSFICTSTTGLLSTCGHITNFYFNKRGQKTWQFLKNMKEQYEPSQKNLKLGSAVGLGKQHLFKNSRRNFTKSGN